MINTAGITVKILMKKLMIYKIQMSNDIQGGSKDDLLYHGRIDAGAGASWEDEIEFHFL